MGKKCNCHLVDFALPIDHKLKTNKDQKREKHLDHEEDEGYSDSNCSWCAWNGP